MIARPWLVAIRRCLHGVRDGRGDGGLAKRGVAGFSVVELKLQMEIGGWGKLLGPLARRVRHNIASLADRNHHLSSFEQARQISTTGWFWLVGCFVGWVVGRLPGS